MSRFRSEWEEYLPSFGAHHKWSTCVRCREPIAAEGLLRFVQTCDCKCCVYCSDHCRNRDRGAHYKHCGVIQKLWGAITAKIIILYKLSKNKGDFSYIHTLFKNRIGCDVLLPEIRKDEIRREKKCYFDLCEKLIKELIREGCRQMGLENRSLAESKKELALQIALDQSMHLLRYRLEGSFLPLHIYLLAGRLQESYNLSCYLASKNCILDEEEITVLRNHMSHPGAAFIGHYDYTKSFFRRRAKSGELFVRYSPGSCRPGNCSTNWEALAHMFLLKYSLHADKINLAAIDEHFLNDTDCTNLIGQFMGMKRERITSHRNYFRDQAFEIVQLFYVDQKYFYASDFYIHQIKQFSEECYPEDVKKLVTSAFDAARARIDYMRKHYAERKLMSPSRWDTIIKSYEHDHNLIYTMAVRPYLPWLVWKINEMAGHIVIGMNLDAKLGVARLVTEAEKALRNSHHYVFSQLYDDDEWHDIVNGDGKDFKSLCPMRGDIVAGNMANYYGVIACLMLEIKLAQCHFNKVCNSKLAMDILSQISDDCSDVQNQTETDFGKDFYEFDEYFPKDKSIESASAWIPIVTKTVQALFDAGIATEKNLKILFGRSSFVSYQIQTLKQNKLGQHQLSISTFVTRRRLWKEGCVDNDKRLGLKLKYLNRLDRSKLFQKMMHLGCVGQRIQSLAPSLQQFVETFGWNTLGLQSEEFFREYYSFCSVSVGKRATRARKKCKHELDNFSTASDACRHFFDTSSLEEAIWDLVDVPRVIALNASKQTMRELGWKCLGLTANTLGNKSVRMGQRVVHVCSGYGTVWEEVKPMEVLVLSPKAER